MIRFICVFSILVAAAQAGTDDTFLLRGATIHTMAGKDIPNGSILVRDGKITGVGQNLTAPADVRVIDVNGLQVYPGMIDSASEVGLSEIGAVRESSDVSEIGDFNPQLRASIAVNPSSEHIPVTRANGITSVIALPAGGMISGQASLIHLDGWTTEEMEIRRMAALHVIFPVIETSSFRFPEGRTTTPYVDAKKSYDRRLQQLNEFFENARRYQKAKAAQSPEFHTDLRLEAMIPVLDRKVPVLISAEKERAIRDALQFAAHQNIRMILATGQEAYRFATDLKKGNIPVILEPTLELPLNEDDPYDRVFTTPGDLYKAGVKFAFGTFSNEFSRNLPYQAAAAVPFGLPHDEAMRAITIDAARIWGVADQLGSIEEGKYADLMVVDGDPLETATQVKQLFIKGKLVDLDNKQKRLYRKYSDRP